MKYDYPSLRIDKTDYLKGNNSYQNYPDGGFVTDSIGANPFSKPGLLAQAPSIGSAMHGAGWWPRKGVLAIAQGGVGAISYNNMVTMAEDTGVGLWGLLSSTTGDITLLAGSDTTVGRTYSLGMIDSTFYNGKMYTAVMDDMVEQNIDGSGRLLTWWTVTKGKAAMTTTVPHPMLVYESILYIADGKYLHKVDNTTASVQVFNCPPNYTITAMTEYNGLIYMVAEPYTSTDGSKHGGAKMFSWDGTTSSWYEEFNINYRVNAMYVYKNRLYMWTNHFMGVWDGAKLVPLRAVANQVFKCMITETADSMFYIDGTSIIRYGAPFIPGAPEHFYNYLTIGMGAGFKFQSIISMTNNNLAITETGFNATFTFGETVNYYISDVNTPATSGYRDLTFNPRFFNKTVKPKRVVVEMEALTASANNGIIPSFINDKGVKITPTYKSGTIVGSDTTQASKTTFEFDFNNVQNTRSMQPVLRLTGDVHIRSVDYFYEPSERGVDKN